MKSTFETRKTAQDIVDYIEAHPDQHEQTTFWSAQGVRPEGASDNICDTTMCIAGTAVLLTEGLGTMIELRDGGSADEWEAKGAHALGLDEHEALRLFYTMDNDAAVEAVRAVANGDQVKFQYALDKADWDT